MSDVVLLSRDGDIATVTLNRPDRLNALDKAMWQRLGEVMKQVATEDATRCAILRGAGAAFGAGADVAEFARERDTPAKAAAYAEIMGAALSALRDSPVPTVAQIHGACAGAGLEIAIHCDLRIAADTSRFGAPVQRLGVTMPYPEIAALIELVGHATALEILLEGRLFGAREAYEKGLVSRVVSEASLDEEVRATARRVADGAPLVHRWHKKFVRRLLDPRPLSEVEVAESYAACGTEDYRAGIEAFLAKEKPRFQGR
jgi:enoyl-CoA hydratase